LVERAWRERYYGLAAALAVIWDTQLSVGDARVLNASQRRHDADGSWFETTRAKTGAIAIGTISRRAEFVLNAYLENLGLQLIGDAALFRNRSGRQYTKDVLAKDFRAIRNHEFPSDKRQMRDFRRSGAIEAHIGNAPAGAMSLKMANTIEDSPELQRVYLPNRVAAVRQADDARLRGRKRLREGK
jgi:hypothetical protein